MTNDEKRVLIALGKRLARECNHSEVEKLAVGSSMILCSICRKDLGWWCPESPNHVCDYYGEHCSMPGFFYNEDDCIYCHQPEERK